MDGRNNFCFIRSIDMHDSSGPWYNHYCYHMQMVVNFFDSEMGLARQAVHGDGVAGLSQHFRCLNAIAL
jgi:hypothetical protein